MFAQRQFAVFLLADQCPPEDEEGFGFFWNGIFGGGAEGGSANLRNEVQKTLLVPEEHFSFLHKIPFK